MVSEENVPAVSESPLQSEEELEPTDIDLLKLQLKESKTEQTKMMAKILDLVMSIELLQENVKGKIATDIDKGGSEGGMIKLESFNKKDMIKPPVYDMEPGNFINWTELFTTYMMSIDPQWEVILKKLQKADVALSREAIDNIHAELRMTQTVK